MSQVSNNTSNGWQSSAGYIWSLIGSAVGFANILSFSAHCYKNGGGAFLIPYMAAMFFLGVPLLMMEGIIGKKWGLPLVSAYGGTKRSIGRLFGWLAIFSCFTIGGFYIVLTGFAVAYVYFSASGAIPADTAAFFKNEFLHMSSGLLDFGGLALPVFLATCAVILVTWWIMSKDICQGVEKICSWCMPALAILVFIFAAFVTFLPGGLQGWIYFLTPDFSRLGDVTLWRDVFGQLLFSLSLGLGIIVGYSRHTRQDFNIAQAMRYVALGDFTVSFTSGAAIFGVIAHISYIQGVPFHELMASDSTFEIGFILFPKILQQFNPLLTTVLGVLFFFSLFIAGITGVFSTVESIAGNVEVEFGLSRTKAVAWTMALLLPTALFFCFGNGMHIVDALAPLVMGTNMLLSTIVMIIVFLFLDRTIVSDDTWSNDGYASMALKALLGAVPLMLLVILVGSLINEWHTFDAAVALRLIWVAVAAVLSTIFVVVRKPAAEPLRASHRAAPAIG